MSGVFSSGSIPIRHARPIAFQQNTVPTSAASAIAAPDHASTELFQSGEKSRLTLGRNAATNGSSTHSTITGDHTARSQSPTCSRGSRFARRRFRCCRRAIFSTRPQYPATTSATSNRASSSDTSLLTSQAPAEFDRALISGRPAPCQCRRDPYRPDPGRDDRDESQSVPAPSPSIPAAPALLATTEESPADALCTHSTRARHFAEPRGGVQHSTVTSSVTLIRRSLNSRETRIASSAHERVTDKNNLRLLPASGGGRKDIVTDRAPVIVGINLGRYAPLPE